MIRGARAARNARALPWLGALWLLLFSMTAAAAPTLVQTNSGASAGAVSVISASYATQPTSGNLLVAIAFFRDAVTSVPIPSGWNNIQTAPNFAPGGMMIWKIAGASEPLTVTIDPAGSSQMGLEIYEYSGIPNAAYREFAGSSGADSTLESSTLTATSANELIVAGFITNTPTSFSTWSNSFNERNDFANTGSNQSTYGGADLVTPAAGGYTTTAQAGAAASWFGQAARFSSSDVNCPGWVVSTTVDSGVGSLRECIKAANANPGADAITVPAGTYTLTIAGTGENAAATGDLDVTETLTISAAGSANTIIQAGTTTANGIDRVFEVFSGVTATMSGAAIRYGRPGSASGGGIRSQGTVSLTDVIVTGNTTSGGLGGGGISSEGVASRLTLDRVTIGANTATGKDGGGIFNEGTATLTDTTISGNTAGDTGGGVKNNAATSSLTLTRGTISGNVATNSGGSFESDGTLNLTNVTISGNSAPLGGGLNGETGTSTLVNCTFSGNSATTGAAIRRNSAAVNLKNTIVANSVSGGNCSGTITSQGNNLDSANTCAFTGPGDKINTNPNLGPLADNGGPTQTHALLPGSPAIDAGTATGAPGTDQRGIARPQGAGYDIGAYEAVTYSIAGKVFEDVNYGGGGGRNWATASANGGSARTTIPRVELFNGSTGAYIVSTTTDVSGNYAFTGLPPGGYTVRVVSSTVTSSRTGFVLGTHLPVLTFRTNASTGTAVDVTDYVGGQDPATADAGNAANLWTLDPATGVFSGSGSGKAHAFAQVTITAGNVTGVDFGFNFDTIVNTNDTGQGSLRQFIANASALGGEASLAQSGSRTSLGVAGPLPAGKETSIFMISDGQAHPGLRAGIANQLTAGVAAIGVSSLLPVLGGANAANTVLDGTTQTFNLGDTNAGTQGVGGTVGVDALALNVIPKPEVQIADGAGLVVGLDVQASNVTLRGLAIYGFGNLPETAGQAGIEVRDTFTGTLIEENFIGATASFAAPGDTQSSNIRSEGADLGTVRNNLIGFSSCAGFQGAAGTTGWTIQGNEIRFNPGGGGYLFGNGIDITSANSGNFTIRGNLITEHNGEDIETGGGIGGNTIVNNTISRSGTAGAFTSGIRLGGNGNVVDRNVFTDNAGAGVLVVSGSTGNTITKNSIWANGPSTGEIGIDLLSASDNQGAGTSPFVTANDSGDGDSGGNGLLNFPILETAQIQGANLVLAGYARPGSVVELFVAEPDPSGFGEGRTWKITLTEGGTGAGGNDPYADTDAGTGTYGPGAINGKAQGTDTTNKFKFTFPAPSGVAIGTALTATATIGGNTSEFGGNVTVAAAPADLALTKTDTPDPAPAGGELLYNVLVTNNGPNNATNVVVTDTLPAGVTLVSATSSQGTCSGTGPVTCNLGGILNGGTVSIEILVVTGAAASITNSAGVTATEPDPVPGNNSASAGTTVVNGGTTDIPLTLYRRIHGFVDYTVTGGSLRTASNTSPCAVGASSTAALSGIPGSASVIGAYLYWAGSSATPDNQVTLDGASLTADRTYAAKYVTGGTTYDFFEGFKDVTAAVQAKRNGNYTFSDLTVTTGNPFCGNQTVLAGWSLIVIYQDSALSGKTLVLYDGFDITRNSSSSYTLAGIFASAPPQAKATFLTWEGDDTLSGAAETLKFNGTPLSDAVNPVNNVYNSTVNSLGVTTSWGVDLDTFDVSSLVLARDTLATVTVSTDADMTILNAVVLEVKSNVIVGTVFEDVSYGGGAGRDLATAVAGAPGFSAKRPGATVELYDATGAIIRTTTTDANGDYGFAGLIDGTYTVRAVNGTVTSSRPGSVAGLWPAQTYRTNASTGTAVGVTDEVGGSGPASQDSGANVTNANLGSFFAQSKAPAQIITGIAVTGVDFGFNFDTVVNKNDSGQGSLRQFVVNSNALTNAGLAQDGKVAGRETSNFMMSDGLAHPGLRAGLPSQLTGGVGVIALASGLPSIADAGTTLDGTTQTSNVGNTNAAVLGQGGSAGVDGLVLSQVPGPEVEIVDGAANLPLGLDVSANDTTVRGISIWGFGTAMFNNGHGTVRVNSGTGALFERNVIGAPATGFTDPGASRTVGQNVWVFGGTGTIRENLVGFAAGSGIDLSVGSGAWTVSGNELRGNGAACSFCEGLVTQTTGHTIRGNLVAANRGSGVDFYNSTSTLLFENNTVTGNGIAAPSNETPGIRVGSGTGARIERNVSTANYGAGVMVASGASGAKISRNSIFLNGTIQNEALGAASGQIGIDLLAAADGQSAGTAPFVTLNDSGDGDSGGNALLNSPVLLSAVVGGPNLTVTGFARPGSTIEFFLADPDPAGFGEGKTYLFTAVEGGGADLDGGTGTYGPGPVNGRAQGTETTNRFQFVVPTPPGVTAGSQLTATATDASNDTSEFSGLGLAVTPGIVKRAFRLDGTPVPDGATIPKGVAFRFLLYVNNPGGLVPDAGVRDVLDPAFTYQAGRTRYDASTAFCAAATCTPAEESAIFAAANAGAIATDAVDGDPVSFSGTTLNVGNNVIVGNAQLDIPAGKVWAVVLSVKMN